MDPKKPASFFLRAFRALDTTSKGYITREEILTPILR
jgi:glutaminase